MKYLKRMMATSKSTTIPLRFAARRGYLVHVRLGSDIQGNRIRSFNFKLYLDWSMTSSFCAVHDGCVLGKSREGDVHCLSQQSLDLILQIRMLRCNLPAVARRLNKKLQTLKLCCMALLLQVKTANLRVSGLDCPLAIDLA